MAEMEQPRKARIFLFPANAEPLIMTKDAIVYADENGGGIAVDNPHITWKGIGFDE